MTRQGSLRLVMSSELLAGVPRARYVLLWNWGVLVAGLLAWPESQGGGRAATWAERQQASLMGLAHADLCALPRSSVSALPEVTWSHAAPW